MPRHDYVCRACSRLSEHIVAWDDRVLLDVHPAPLLGLDCYGVLDRVYRHTAAPHDSIIPGGPRWFHNLDDHPIWIETRGELAKEMTSRGLVHAERRAHAADDQSPWATPTRLRPGTYDPFLPPGEAPWRS